MEEELTKTSKVVGFVDVGTNAIRLLVVRINPNLSYSVISQEKEVVRLGENEFKDNLLKPDAMNRAILVCKKFAELARTYGASEIIAVGTSAIREAHNQEKFLQRLLTETGLNLHVISGLEEARLIYCGVSSGVDIGEEKAIFIDLGGGSTEFAIGNQNDILYLDSIKLGAIRLTSQFIGEGWTGRIRYKLYKSIKKEVSSNISRVVSQAKAFGAKLAFGSSGTIINLAEISSKMFKKNNDGAQGHVLSKKNLKKTAQILCALTLEERKKIPGINPERADILVAGAAAMDAIMEEFGLEEINVSHKELRDGLLVDYLSTFESFREFQKIPVRNRSVLHLSRVCNYDEKHSETVASLATQLFDSAKAVGLHNLQGEERELLKYAATMHDIGDFLSFNDHHLHAHYIISNASLLGFDQKEITIMANVARFHRKKYPSGKALKATGLDENSKTMVMMLAVFLRLAEKLDRSHCAIVKKAEFSNVEKDRVRLSLFSDSDCSMEEWSVVQNGPAFYGAFGKKLDAHCVNLRPTDPDGNTA
jgi:exopolyphosphatase/guanosine-5'-triphosphate,3'-diphosphate pyrophosphatase